MGFCSESREANAMRSAVESLGADPSSWLTAGEDAIATLMKIRASREIAVLKRIGSKNKTGRAIAIIPAGAAQGYEGTAYKQA
jgi:hypothetical protein